MSLPVILTPRAQREISDAAAWYAERSILVAERFMGEVETLIRRMSERPLQFPSVGRTDARRASFRRFPYVLLSRVSPDQVDLFACFHTARDPSVWRAGL